MKDPTASATRWVSAPETKRHTVPAADSFVITALAVVAPAVKLTLDVFGRIASHG
jgi:hypothetical protein